MSLEYVANLYVQTKADVEKLIYTESLLRSSVQNLRQLCITERDKIIQNCMKMKDAAKANINAEITMLKETHDDMLTMFVATDDIITVNVGGTKFASSRVVLSKEKGSVLHWAVSDPPPTTLLRDSEGNTFFDRDADMFPFILHYLRTGMLPMDVHKNEYRKLRSEAEYFGLRGLLLLMDGLNVPGKTTRVQYAVLTYNNNFAPSSFMGMPPDNIELFYFQGDCFKSYKEMTQVLADMRHAGWELVLNINPGKMNGRLLFCKQEIV